MRTIAYKNRKFFFAPLILVALAIFSAVTMALWNVLMPVLFHLPVITFWQAAGLLILARLFFGGGRPHRAWPVYSWRNDLRKKIAKMSLEERKEFFRNRRENLRAWHREYFEGKDSDIKDDKNDQ